MRNVAIDSTTLYYVGGSSILDKLYKRSISSSGTIGSTETEIRDIGTGTIIEIKTHPNTDGFIGIVMTGSSNYYVSKVELVSSTGSVLKHMEDRKSVV